MHEIVWGYENQREKWDPFKNLSLYVYGTQIGITLYITLSLWILGPLACQSYLILNNIYDMLPCITCDTWERIFYYVMKCYFRGYYFSKDWVNIQP